MNTWNWNGARWWKFDFHAHTPASDDYGRGPNQVPMKERTPREWLLDYMRAGIDCVAVTDHNTGEWVDRLKSELDNLEKEKPAGFRRIHIFSAMEISVSGGIHLLAIFDPAKTTSDLDALRGAVEYEGTPGKSNGVTRKSFVEVVDAVVWAGGIALPAHVDETNGLFQLEQQGTTLEQVLNCGHIFAMELMDPAFAKPQPYNDKKLHWAEVLGSGSHHPTGNAGQRYPGSHFTWIKMGTPGIEGLRLALLDGPISVKRSDVTTDDPNRHTALAIESIEVSKARYIGRANSFKLEMNPWLNAVIGGRGTGKSTVVEFLRLVLRREKELPETLQKDFSKYFEVYASRDEEGLLTEDSHFTVMYRKNGARYRVQWSQRGEAEPIEVEEDEGSWKAEQGEIVQRFPVRIYSQKQIFELAKAPLALLRIVDESPEVDRRSWEEGWKAEESRFLSLRAKSREIEAGLSDKPRLQGELKDIQHKLAVFEQVGHADILKEYQKRLRQQRVVEEWGKSWSGAGDRLREMAEEILPDPLDPAFFDPDKPEDRELLKKASNTIETIQQVHDDLGKSARKLEGILSKWSSEQKTSPWTQAVKMAIEAYDQLRANLAKQAAGDPSAYGELVQRRQMLEGRLKEFGSRNKQLDLIQKEAGESLERLLEIRQDLTARRKAFLEKVLKGNRYVRIEVVPYGAREIVEGEFRSLIQRDAAGGFEKDIGTVDNGEGLLGDLYAGTPDADELERRLAQLKAKVTDVASGKAAAGALRDQRFATHLEKLAPEVLDRLDLWFPEDSLRVEYSTTGDGSGFRSIQEGSPGQKTAALLAFLLSYGEEPIVLDQPEDDLDNHLIYDLIVTQLRNIKQSRQVIVVTHNANIVVNGDAELVVGLAARGGETQRECSGCLQERAVRDTICAIMEGGREAFEQRYRRIALEV